MISYLPCPRFLALGLNQPNTAHQTCRAPGNERGSCRHLHHCLQVYRRKKTIFGKLILRFPCVKILLLLLLESIIFFFLPTNLLLSRSLQTSSASSPTFALYKAGQIIVIIIVIVKIIKIIIMTMISYIGVCCPDSSSPQLPPTPAPTQPPTPAPTQAPNPPPTRGKPSPPCKTSIHQTRRNTIYFLL